MTRLNKSVRDQIVQNAIVKSGATARNEALVTRRTALAEACRIESFGGAESLAATEAEVDKINALIRELPNCARIQEQSIGETERAIDVAFGGLRARIPFSETDDNVWKQTIYDRFLLPADHPLTEEFKAIEKEQRIVDDLTEQVRLNVTAMVNSVTTVKKLIELWPEGAELIPDDANEPRINLPSVDVAQLNAMIGVPSK